MKIVGNLSEMSDTEAADYYVFCKKGVRKIHRKTPEKA